MKDSTVDRVAAELWFHNFPLADRPKEWADTLAVYNRRTDPDKVNLLANIEYYRREARRLIELVLTQEAL